MHARGGSSGGGVSIAAVFASLAFMLLFAVALIAFLFNFLLPNVRGDEAVRAASGVPSLPGGDLSTLRLRQLFDADFSLATLRSASQPKTRADSFDSATMEGPLVPANCSQVRRLCLVDRDCSLLCVNSQHGGYECDQRTMTCDERAVDVIEGGSSAGGGNGDGGSGDGSDSGPARCNTKIGEYALLQGYNELGVAIWNCVQLYPGWEHGGERYCEGGTVNLDVRVRTPSYRDCVCPSGTTRIVYAKSQLGQQLYGLPHCVKHSELYNLGTDYLAPSD